MENKWKLFNENQWEWINVCSICSFHGTNVETYTYQRKWCSNQSWFNIATCEHSLRKLGICRPPFHTLSRVSELGHVILPKMGMGQNLLPTNWTVSDPVHQPQWLGPYPTLHIQTQWSNGKWTKTDCPIASNGWWAWVHPPFLDPYQIVGCGSIARYTQ